MGSWLEKGNESVRVDDEFHCVRGEGLLSCCTNQYTAENTVRFSGQRTEPRMLQQTAPSKLDEAVMLVTIIGRCPV